MELFRQTGLIRAKKHLKELGAEHIKARLPDALGIRNPVTWAAGMSSLPAFPAVEMDEICSANANFLPAPYLRRVASDPGLWPIQLCPAPAIPCTALRLRAEEIWCQSMQFCHDAVLKTIGAPGYLYF
jgi:hypothetical protein